MNTLIYRLCYLLGLCLLAVAALYTAGFLSLLAWVWLKAGWTAADWFLRHTLPFLTIQ